MTDALKAELQGIFGPILAINPTWFHERVQQLACKHMVSYDEMRANITAALSELPPYED